MSRDDKQKHDEELDHLRKEVGRLTKLSEVKLRPELHYNLRTIGAVAILFALGAMVQGISFFWFAVLLTVGLVLLILDPWIEPSLRPHKGTRILNTAVFSIMVSAKRTPSCKR